MEIKDKLSKQWYVCTNATTFDLFYEGLLYEVEKMIEKTSEIHQRGQIIRIVYLLSNLGHSVHNKSGGTV